MTHSLALSLDFEDALGNDFVRMTVNVWDENPFDEGKVTFSGLTDEEGEYYEQKYSEDGSIAKRMAAAPVSYMGTYNSQGVPAYSKDEIRFMLPIDKCL